MESETRAHGQTKGKTPGHLAGRIAAPDPVDLELGDNAPEPVKRAATHPGTLWKSLVGAQNEAHPDGSVVFELAQKLIEIAPDFPKAPEVYLARARACAALAEIDPHGSAGLEAWIAYGLAIDRAPENQALSFAARAELAQAYAQMAPADTPRFLFDLAMAHADTLKERFPDREKDRATLLDALGNQALKRNDYAAAIRAYTQLIEQETPTQEWLAAPQKIAAAYKAAGNTEEALKWTRNSASQYPDRVDRYLAEAENQPAGKHQGYLMNRSRFAARHAAADVEARLLGLTANLGEDRQAAEIRRGFLLDLLGHVPARAQWLELARSAAKAGNTDEALAGYLRALKPARTVLPEMRAKHPANQAYLDALRQPQAPEELEEIFAYVCGDAVRSPAFRRKRGEAPQSPTAPSLPPEGGTTNHTPPSDNIIPTAINTWQTYWQQERDGPRHEARTALKQFLASSLPHSYAATQAPRQSSNPPLLHHAILPLLARLAIAKSYQQEGLHFRAIAAFNQAGSELHEDGALSPKERPSLHHFFTTAITYGRGLSYFRRGQYESAAEEFTKARAGRQLLPQARYRIAQCLEFQASFRRARQAYSEVTISAAFTNTLSSSVGA